MLGANSLETSKAILDFGEMKAIFFSCEVPLTKIGSGHFCVSILPNVFTQELQYHEENTLIAPSKQEKETNVKDDKNNSNNNNKNNNNITYKE